MALPLPDPSPLVDFAQSLFNQFGDQLDDELAKEAAERIVGAGEKFGARNKKVRLTQDEINRLVRTLGDLARYFEEAKKKIESLQGVEVSNLHLRSQIEEIGYLHREATIDLKTVDAKIHRYEERISILIRLRDEALNFQGSNVKSLPGAEGQAQANNPYNKRAKKSD